MTTKNFEKLVKQHSFIAGEVSYNSNALAGEAGEVCNNVKKYMMSIMRPDWVTQNENSLPTTAKFRSKIQIELSDVFYYLAKTALQFNITLDKLMDIQAAKLAQQSKEYGRVFLK